MESKRLRKKGIIVSAIFCVFTAGLASFSYFSYAWFSSSRKVNVNFSKTSVGDGLEIVSTRRLNHVDANNQSFLSYPLSGYSVPTGATYSSLFSSDSLLLSSYQPGYASTYCFKVNNLSSSPIGLRVSLESYTAPASTLAFKDALKTQPFSLDEPILLYSSLVLEANLESGMKSFLEESDPLSAARTDRFHENDGSISLPKTITADDSPLIGGNSFGYLFLTIDFSTLPKYLYTETEAGVFTADPLGNSNPFMGLTFGFGELSFSPIFQ